MLKLHRYNQIDRVVAASLKSKQMISPGNDSFYDRPTAFCDEELTFGIVMEGAMKNNTDYRTKYYRS